MRVYLFQDFFYFLHNWHEEKNNDWLWEKLNLGVVYSTEDFGNLDINQLPFDVGFLIEFKPIVRSQLAELADGYGLDLSAVQNDRFMTMLERHSYFK